MRRPRRSRFPVPWAVAGIVALGLPLATQAQEQIPDPLTIAWVQGRSAAVEASLLPEDAKNAALASYRKAEEYLKASAEASARANEFQRMAAEGPGLMATIREELARPPADRDVSLGAQLPQLEQELSRALGEQRAAAEQIEQLRQESLKRADRRAALPDQIAQAKQQLIEAEPPPKVSDEPEEVSFARAVEYQSARQLRLATLRALEQEQTAYEVRAELLPVRRDRAQRRQTEADRSVAALQDAVAERRRREAEDATRKQAERLRQTARDTPLLAALAETNHAYAERRSGDAGITGRLEAIGRELTATQEQLSKLTVQFEGTRRRVQAAGLTQAMGLLLRRQYDALPDADQLTRRSHVRLDEISRVQVQLIELEESRSEAGDVEGALPEVLSGLPAVTSEERLALEVVARELLLERRELLGTLVSETGLLFQRLIELDTVARRLAAVAEEYRGFVAERILWTRSVSGDLLPSASALTQGGGWLMTPRGWAEGLGNAWSSVQARPSQAVQAVALLLLIGILAVWARRRSRRRDRAATLGRTLSTLGEAALVALPVPAVLFALAHFLSAAVPQTDLGRALGAGLETVAVYLFVFAAAWRILRDRGPGKTEFHWPLPATRQLRRQLAWFVPVKLACEFLVAAFASQPNNGWDDALGRFAFVVDVIAMSVFLQRILRPSGPLRAAPPAEGASGSVQWLRFLWYPLAVGTPLALAGLAVTGYYYTALRFSQRLEATLLLVLGLVVVRAVLLRWMLLERRRLARLETTASVGGAAVSPPATEGAAAPEVPQDEASGDAPLTPVQVAEASSQREQVVYEFDMEAIRKRTRQLFHSLIAMSMIVGLFVIWADVLPALRRLDQVQVWPGFAVLEAGAEAAPLPTAPSADVPAPATPSAEPVGLPTSAAPPVAPDVQSNVTLADVSLALLLVFLTVVATKNLPALLEMVVLARLPVDAGARYAVVSVVRYAIVIVGATSALNALGISWGSVQWLAAALTFGLAFGLQEIFANFVSGLIILFERPVRVGDVVTVNGVNGKIARIRIRATTVLDWNAKELIIPNREFVTGQVINWTLTETRVRLQIPIGVAYGTDVALAKRLLLEAAHAHEAVRAEPEPTAVFEGFGDSVYNLELRVHLPDPSYIPQTRDDLLMAVKAAFTEHGVEIAFPQRDLHIRSADAVFRVEQTRADPLGASAPRSPSP